VVFRHPLETRPLSLKQGDNKLVASTINYCITPAIKEGAIDTQRGFIGDRQLAQNAIDLDYGARKNAFEYFGTMSKLAMIHIPTIGVVGSLPFLILFDYASAFPSVAHAWLFAVLAAIELWPGFIRAIKNLYRGNEAYGMAGGIMAHMFSILSGVLQGCPLSGTLFVLVVDPLLWMFRTQMSEALVRACADDVGMALRRLDSLALLYKIFEDYRKATNLTLKAAKCVLVVTVCKLSGWNVDMIRAWLRRRVPGWKDMKIQDAAKYLVFFLGPRAGAIQWERLLGKNLAVAATRRWKRTCPWRLPSPNSIAGPFQF
jgi:hypothetical protein